MQSLAGDLQTILKKQDWLLGELGTRTSPSEQPTLFPYSHIHQSRSNTPLHHFIPFGRANRDGCDSQWNNVPLAPRDSQAAREVRFNDIHNRPEERVKDCGPFKCLGTPEDRRA